MTVPTVNGCGEVADCAEPGELIRLVAEGLVGCGLDVRLSDPEGSAQLTIACEAGQCVLWVNDWGYAEWDYRPRSKDEADPRLTADMATALLTGRAGPFECLAGGDRRDDITFKGIVGRELTARGLEGLGGVAHESRVKSGDLGSSPFWGRVRVQAAMPACRVRSSMAAW